MSSDRVRAWCRFCGYDWPVESLSTTHSIVCPRCGLNVT